MTTRREAELSDRIGRFIGILAVSALLVIVWTIFIAGTLWALAELGVLDPIYSVSRGVAVSWIYLSIFSLIVGGAQLSGTLSTKLSQSEQSLQMLKDNLEEHRATLARAQAQTGAKQ